MHFERTQSHIMYLNMYLNVLECTLNTHFYVLQEQMCKNGVHQMLNKNLIRIQSARQSSSTIVAYQIWHLLCLIFNLIIQKKIGTITNCGKFCEIPL